jgi:hypothetical protein
MCGDDKLKETGSVEVDHTFTISLRDILVLALKEQWNGFVLAGGVVETDRGRWTILGVEFEDILRERKSWICVCVARSQAEGLIHEGYKLKFYATKALIDANRTRRSQL